MPTSASVGQEVDRAAGSSARSRAAASDRSSTASASAVEPRCLQPLGAEALHDADAGDALLDDAGEVAELLLEREADRARCGA